MTDIVERLRERARSASEASKLLARAKTERNAAAEGTVIPPEQGYRGLEPEQTIECEAASEIERLRSQTAVPPSPVSGEGDDGFSADEFANVLRQLFSPRETVVRAALSNNYNVIIAALRRAMRITRPPEPAASGDAATIAAAIQRLWEVQEATDDGEPDNMGDSWNALASYLIDHKDALIAALNRTAPDTGEWNAAVEACAKIAEARYLQWKLPHPDDAAPGEVCDDISACRDVANAIRSLKRPAPQRESDAEEAAYMSREGMNVDLTETERQLRKQESGEDR